MNWTHETPEKSGWYWCEPSKEIGKAIVFIDELSIAHHGLVPCAVSVFIENAPNIRWSGPIPEPEEGGV